MSDDRISSVRIEVQTRNGRLVGADEVVDDIDELQRSIQKLLRRLEFELGRQ